jgi:hypothetical protein
MQDNKPAHPLLSQAEINLIEQLRKHPQMMERVQGILAIANDTQGPVKTADQVEELLIEEMRKLGNSTMNNWAQGAHERVALELKAKDPTVRCRKKKR